MKSSSKFMSLPNRGESEEPFTAGISKQVEGTTTEESRRGKKGKTNACLNLLMFSYLLLLYTV